MHGFVSLDVYKRQIDEPTTGLDPEERIRIRNLLVDFSKDRTVPVSYTHLLPGSRMILSCPTDDGSCMVLILLSGRSHITG